MPSIDKNQEEEARNSSDLVVGHLSGLRKIVFLDLKNCKVGTEDCSQLVREAVSQCDELSAWIDGRVTEAVKERFYLSAEGSGY